jgi:hypothetical protein
VDDNACSSEFNADYSDLEKREIEGTGPSVSYYEQKSVRTRHNSNNRVEQQQQQVEIPEGVRTYIDDAQHVTYTLQYNLCWIMTKRNKGTVVGVYSTKENAEKARMPLGGERYYRISHFIMDHDVYHD